jgi:hypothetical protein
MSSKVKRKKKKESKTGYLCGTDFQDEICDDNAHHVELYGSLSALKHHKKCFNSCGIVKVTVTVEKWVLKQDLSKEIENGT